MWCTGWTWSTRRRGYLDTWKRSDVFRFSAWKCKQCSLKIKHPTTCHNVVFLQDLSHLHQKIERLEHLLGDNNRLVIRLHDTLDQQKKLLKGGEKANQSLVEAPPGCQLIKGVNNGTDGVQVSSSNYVCNTVWLYWWSMPKHLDHWLCCSVGGELEQQRSEFSSVNIWKFLSVGTKINRSQEIKQSPADLHHDDSV